MRVHPDTVLKPHKAVFHHAPSQPIASYFAIVWDVEHHKAISTVPSPHLFFLLPIFCFFKKQRATTIFGELYASCVVSCDEPYQSLLRQSTYRSSCPITQFVLVACDTGKCL